MVWTNQTPTQSKGIQKLLSNTLTRQVLFSSRPTLDLKRKRTEVVSNCLKTFNQQEEELYFLPGLRQKLAFINISKTEHSP